MSEVIQFPKVKLTEDDREREDMISEFSEIGLDKKESVILAILVQQIMKLQRKINKLEERI